MADNKKGSDSRKRAAPQRLSGLEHAASSRDDPPSSPPQAPKLQAMESSAKTSILQSAPKGTHKQITKTKKLLQNSVPKAARKPVTKVKASSQSAEVASQEVSNVPMPTFEATASSQYTQEASREAVQSHSGAVQLGEDTTALHLPKPSLHDSSPTTATPHLVASHHSSIANASGLLAPLPGETFATAMAAPIVHSTTGLKVDATAYQFMIDKFQGAGATAQDLQQIAPFSIYFKKPVLIPIPEDNTCYYYGKVIGAYREYDDVMSQEFVVHVFTWDNDPELYSSQKRKLVKVNRSGIKQVPAPTTPGSENTWDPDKRRLCASNGRKKIANIQPNDTVLAKASDSFWYLSRVTGVERGQVYRIQSLCHQQHAGQQYRQRDELMLADVASATKADKNKNWLFPGSGGKLEPVKKGDERDVVEMFIAWAKNEAPYRAEDVRQQADAKFAGANIEWAWSPKL